MNSVKLYAFAKINLTLEILGTRRDDGYHDIASVMKKAPLFDEVTVNVSDGDGVTLTCDKDVCPPAENLAYKAAKLYMEQANLHKCIHVDIVKNIPSGAGLAGGSADGAAVLDGLNEHFQAFGDGELHALALSLGSDVPFCLKKHACALCTGRGEIMEELPNIRFELTMRFPKTPLSTAGIYREYDTLYGDDYGKSNSEKMAFLIKKGATVSEIMPYMVNDFQALCEKRCPEITHCIEELTKQGYASQMSGSGSAVFGIK